ncbi:MAG: type II toxin-antitoxin system VapC family toxin [Pseudomonadales bacterium]|nr:type II toxin-antitoxin system VapC family toxin [Pseudomonadales bacterium]
MTCCWLFEDENHAESEAVLLEVGANGAYAPNLWWAEIRNVLITSERTGRMNPRETAMVLTSLARLDVRLDNEPNEVELLTLARRHRLTIYDALYLELAHRFKAPLATLDHALIRAARSESIHLKP